MKFFIAQRVTGEDMIKLKEESIKIVRSLKKAGHEAYCTMLEDVEEFNKKSKREIMKHAFNEINNSDAIFVVVRREDKSEGLLMEVGYTFGKKKKIILAINSDVKNTYIRDIADEVIEFKNTDDLINKISKIRI